MWGGGGKERGDEGGGKDKFRHVMEWSVMVWSVVFIWSLLCLISSLVGFTYGANHSHVVIYGYDISFAMFHFWTSW